MADQNQSHPVMFEVEGRSYAAESGESLLQALRRHGFVVPSLCHHEAVSSYGACRLCLVEVKKGSKTKLTTSCNFPVQEGIQVLLDTEKVVRHRKMVLQLLLANAPAAESVRALAAEYGVHTTPFEERTGESCIDCGLCSRVCKDIVGANALAAAGRGVDRKMTTPYDEENEACIGCGACAYVCPTRCIEVKDEDGVRVLERWHRRMPLRMCKRCGRPIAPVVQLSRFSAEIGGDAKRFELCADCR